MPLLGGAKVKEAKSSCVWTNSMCLISVCQYPGFSLWCLFLAPVLRLEPPLPLVISLNIVVQKGGVGRDCLKLFLLKSLPETWRTISLLYFLFNLVGFHWHWIFIMYILPNITPLWKKKMRHSLISINLIGGANCQTFRS